MSAGPEPSGDLVAVACVVEASLLLASEWPRVLIEYVYPLLKRLNELHPSHQFRLAFVTYGAADTRPHPLLSKRYFAPLSLVTRELREEPSKLGIGQTSSGSGRGLSALEGLVAAIELFDILMASANFSANHAQTQSPQKDNRSLVSHLLHIAASPPDNSQRPQCNTLQHLDFVNWDSIPAELRKRKINLSLISLRKIPQFQDLQSSVAGPTAQSPWFSVHTPHVLLLAGFPTPQKAGSKRQPDALPSEQSPDAKRQKVVADPVSKTSSASPALPPARIPQNQRSQQPTAPHVSQSPSKTAPSQGPTPVQPIQGPPSVPAPTPANTSPSAPPLPTGPSLPAFTKEVQDQMVAQTGLKFSQMMERLKVLERDVPLLDAKIAGAQGAGQTADLAALQKERATKAHIREQIKMLLRQHFQKMHLSKEAANAQANVAGPAVSNPSVEAGPSIQSQQSNAPSTSSDRPMGVITDENKPAVPDSQVLAQFWQSRGGTISAPSGGNPQVGPSQRQPHQSSTPEVTAQMQKLLEKKGIRPTSFGPSLQTPETTSHEPGINANPTNNQVIFQAPNTTAWLGTFLGNFGSQWNEVQIHVAGVFTTPMPTGIRTEIRTDLWPKNFTLKPCKEPVKDSTELRSWLKRHQSRLRVMQFKPHPRAPDGPLNEQRFHALNRYMDEHRIFAYAGWQLPSGKFSYNILIFPTGSWFAGAMFPDGLPDLPGIGNALDTQPSVGESKPLSLNGVTFPPALIAHMQNLEPAKQKQILAHFIRVQQEQLRRQQLQQTQQAYTAPSQALNLPGMSIPPNSYSAVANIPAGLHANVGAPTNAGAYNSGGGTVNHEMMQSFMQRNADGSTSQGMSSSSMP